MCPCGLIVVYCVMLYGMFLSCVVVCVSVFFCLMSLDAVCELWCYDVCCFLCMGCAASWFVRGKEKCDDRDLIVHWYNA